VPEAAQSSQTMKLNHSTIGGAAPVFATTLAALAILVVALFVSQPSDGGSPADLSSVGDAAPKSAGSLVAGAVDPAIVPPVPMSQAGQQVSSPVRGGAGSAQISANPSQLQSRQRETSDTGISVNSKEPAGATDLMAEMEGDSSAFELPEEGTDAARFSSPAEMQAAILGNSETAESKLDIMADLVPKFASDSEAISFLTAVASDSRQPEELRADAVAKLADFGPQHVEAFASSDSEEVAAEVDLFKRLEDYRRQEGLPPGSIRSDLR
jgi:hypothetical protein